MTDADLLAHYGLLPRVDVESLRSVVAELLYAQHGGSWSGLRLPDVEAMELHQLRWWQRWLARRREDEAKALRAAYKKGHT